MKRALRLAQKALGKTSPNPLVGAVIVKAGRTIAEGYHEMPGLPHAEAVALERAGAKARGATLYVNLEPCCHLNKRTPPCAQAIIRAGIKRVVVGMIDPNPKVSGRGVELLRRSGIDVQVGILEEESKRLNEFYIKHITTGMPFVILKVAMTLDGKIATESGDSKWITSLPSRRYVHKLRSTVDAVLTGIGTVRADDPELTVRLVKGRNPVRVVVDPEFEISMDANILKTPPPTIIFTRNKNHPPLPDGIEVEYFDSERLDLRDAMKRLYQKGITSVLIEGGSSINYNALRDGVVDKVLFFISPKIIGGKDSITPVGGVSTGLDKPWRIRDMKTRRIGKDILIEGYIDSSSLSPEFSS